MSFSTSTRLQWVAALLLLLWIQPYSYAQNVGINGDGSSPENNTMLDIKSTGNTSAVYGLKVKDSGANDQFVVRSDGRVGVGTTTPLSPFHVRAPSWDVIRAERNGIGDSWSWTLDALRMHFLNWDTQESILTLGKNRHVGINWTAPIGALEVRADKDLVLDSAFTFTDAGFMGIGTRNAKNKLDVEGGAVIGAIYSGTNTAPVNGLLVEGRVGIGTTTPAQLLDVNGNIAVSGTTVHTSDVRYKTNVITLPHALEQVQKLRGVRYNWKASDFPDKNFGERSQIGVIAQEVESIFPELVYEDADGFKSVDYSHITPILIEAIKEQQQIIEEQRAEITTLKKADAATVLRLEALEGHIKTAEK